MTVDVEGGERHAWRLCARSRVKLGLRLWGDSNGREGKDGVDNRVEWSGVGG